MKIHRIFLPVLLSAMLMTGCSSSGSASSSYNDGMVMETYAAAAGYDDYVNDSVNLSADIKETSAETDKKIIRNAVLDMQTKNLDETYGKLTAKLYEFGGSIFSEETDRNDYNASTNAVFTISPEYLDAFLDYAEECGTVSRKSISSEDITGQYIDVEVRLENKRRNLDKYYEMLEDANRMEEIIQIQSEINMITSDIESYEAQLQMWNKNIAESRINISVFEVEDPSKVEVEDVTFSTLSFSNMGKLMWNGIKKCVDVIGTVLQWLLIIIVTLLPVLIVAGIVIAIVIISRRALDKKYPERIEQRRKRREHVKNITQNVQNRTTTAYIPPQAPDNTDNTDNKKTD
jgi:major membrane immunogen (membrane-anchored lipoprotein)